MRLEYLILVYMLLLVVAMCSAGAVAERQQRVERERCALSCKLGSFEYGITDDGATSCKCLKKEGDK